jgi:voltage-gated potassium channel
MCDCPCVQNTLAWLREMKTAMLKQKPLGYALSLAVAATFLFGLAVFLVDPNVRSLADGVWYAWVTMTHVGYGDVVPTSFLGRVLASVLILFGLAVLALLTATFSAILIERDMGGTAKDERSVILAEIKRLHERLDQLEAKRAQGE